MNFNVGDRVIVRDDLIPFRRYGGMCFTSGMAECSGVQATILEAYDDNGTYLLDCYSAPWFTDDMLSPVGGFRTPFEDLY